MIRMQTALLAAVLAIPLTVVAVLAWQLAPVPDTTWIFSIPIGEDVVWDTSRIRPGMDVLWNYRLGEVCGSVLSIPRVVDNRWIEVDVAPADWLWRRVTGDPETLSASMLGVETTVDGLTRRVACFVGVVEVTQENDPVPFLKEMDR